MSNQFVLLVFQVLFFAVVVALSVKRTVLRKIPDGSEEKRDARRRPRTLGKSFFISTLLGWFWFMPIVFVTMRDIRPEYDATAGQPLSQHLLAMAIASLLFNGLPIGILSLLVFYAARKFTHDTKPQAYALIYTVVWCLAVWLNPIVYGERGLMAKYVDSPVLCLGLTQLSLGIACGIVLTTLAD